MTSSFFFFKQKTAYELRISDWSSDVCSSDLLHHRAAVVGLRQHDAVRRPRHHPREVVQGERRVERIDAHPELLARAVGMRLQRSEEHTSELQSLMRTSYAVFCLKKKKK